MRWSSSPFPTSTAPKKFYSRLGWRLDADRAAGDNFRLVQFTPPGSGSSIQFGVNLTSAEPGSAQAMLLAVSDIDAARSELIAHGVDASQVFHCETGTACRFSCIGARVTGPHPERLSYYSFVSFSDPDGNGDDSRCEDLNTCHSNGEFPGFY